MILKVKNIYFTMECRANKVEKEMIKENLHRVH